MSGLGVAGAGAGNVMLWPGGSEVMKKAAELASNIGYRTLEQTAAGRILTGTQNIATKILGSDKAYSILRPLWDKASLQFVKSADNVVHICLNSEGINDTSVFMRIEYEYLKETGASIVFHLVSGD